MSLAGGVAPRTAALEVSPALAHALEAARARWPELQVPVERFARRMAEASSDGSPCPHPEDVYLACACEQGDARAIRSFQETYGPAVVAAFRHLGIDDQRIEDLKQGLWAELFADGQKHKIAQYHGHGRLSRWVAATAAHAAIDGRRKAGRDAREVMVGQDLLEAMLSPTGDPALEYVKEVYRQQLRASFVEAVALLAVRERNVLRFSLLEGLSVDEIGTMYRVHRATAARWLVKARETLVQHTRAALLRRLDASSVESVLRLVESCVDLSIHRVLGEPEPEK